MKKLISFAESLITDCTELGELLQLDLTNYKSLSATSAVKQFPLRVPSAFALRMGKADINDPLLMQVLPVAQADGSDAKVGYTDDPLQETHCSPILGLLHKYYGRVLLQLTKDCPINCRFCFRRYCRTEVKDWERAFEYIRRHRTITEVILSGGEPLLWAEEHLGWLLGRLSAIPNVKRIRIHTRLPITMPQYITDSLLRMLKSWQGRFVIIFVVHCNHPQEIDEQVHRVLKRLGQNNFVTLSQTVLLKNINDEVSVLASLAEKLFSAGVLPYYLHLLDKVKGAETFHVNDERAKALVGDLRALLPGYLVPRLVREEPGALAKSPV